MIVTKVEEDFSNKKTMYRSARLESSIPSTSPYPESCSLRLHYLWRMCRTRMMITDGGMLLLLLLLLSGPAERPWWILHRTNPYSRWPSSNPTGPSSHSASRYQAQSTTMMTRCADYRSTETARLSPDDDNRIGHTALRYGMIKCWTASVAYLTAASYRLSPPCSSHHDLYSTGFPSHLYNDRGTGHGPPLGANTVGRFWSTQFRRG